MNANGSQKVKKRQNMNPKSKPDNNNTSVADPDPRLTSRIIFPRA